jgi:broad specificity phosphatase PhoE
VLRRVTAALSQSTSPRMIYLVRHGQTEFNRDGRFQGHVESPLTALGEAQARAVGERLKALAAADPGNWAIECSPLGRARQTAEIITGVMGLPAPAVEPRLIEVFYGDLEGLTRPQVDERWPELVGVRGVFVRSPGGETLAALQARARAWLDEACADDGRRRIAVAHASVGRALRGLYTGLDVEDMVLLETPQDAFHRLHDGKIERIDCAPLSPAAAER